MADTDGTDVKDEANDNEEEEEIDETQYKTVKDAVLFAIDVSQSMLQPTAASDAKKPDQDTATSVALKCAYSLMQQRIISNPNDMMGILLFGTEQTKFHESEDGGVNGGASRYPHCYLLADLDVPAAADVKRLRSMIEDEEESKQLLVPSTELVSMSSVLFCANQIFTARAANFSSRRLFLVTDNDNPHASDKDLKSSAIVRAKDLYDLGVSIELFPISQPGHEFDCSKFYDDVVYRPPSDPEAPAPISKATKASTSSDGISLLTSLLTSVHSKNVPRRALFSSVPLELAPNFKISVKGYIIFKRQEPKRSCYVWLDGETPQVAVGSTKKPDDQPDRPPEKVEVRKAFKFGGESVVFTPEEISALRNFGDPVIRIIGFKPLSMLPIWASVRPSTFIYPSEEGFVGSTRTFSALQQNLLRKQKFALVWYIPRRNAAPYLAALYPGAEETSPENGEQKTPPGLWVIHLPFADDIRANPETNTDIRAPDVLKDKMRDVIRQLQLPGAVYDPCRYPNPSLQWHYRILQALALEEDLPEKPEDKTIPKYRQIHKRAGGYVVEWGEALQEEFRKWQLSNAKQQPGVKREGGPSASTAKKARSETPATPARSAALENGTRMSDDEMKKHFNKNTINKLTLPVLKDWLSSKKLSTSGKKANLVERIEQHLESRMDLN